MYSSQRSTLCGCVQGCFRPCTPTLKYHPRCASSNTQGLLSQAISTLATITQQQCPQVLGGADLFLQGLIVPDSGLGTFAAGDLRVASIPKNEYPFAVGVMEAGSADIAKTGLKGKGLKLLHHFPDMLWALGDKSVPDASFTPNRIFPQVPIPSQHPALLHCHICNHMCHLRLKKQSSRLASISIVTDCYIATHAITVISGFENSLKPCKRRHCD